MFHSSLILFRKPILRITLAFGFNGPQRDDVFAGKSRRCRVAPK
jgi:hypothetical protein